MNTVACPHCGKEIEIDKALKHQIEENVLREERSKHKQELEKLALDADKKAEKRIKEEVELKLKNSHIELEEAKEKGEKLQEDLLSQMKAFRKLQDEQAQKEIEMEKRLQAERSKISEELSKTLKEKSDLETAELKKQLEDTKKALEDAQRKAAQKSQQLQGEVLELELENLLKTSFPQDDITPVGKGITGADIKHTVKSPKGFACGTILWESKRTKSWDDKWVTKLKTDLRSEKALLAVIVSTVLPKEVNGFGVIEGVWVSSYELILPLATILRKNLLDVGYQKAISANKGGKAESLYNYVTSHEFQQQIESVVESYREMLTQITKERASFEKSWKARESQAHRVLVSTANIVGSMQGIVGTSLPPIKGLDLLEEGEES